MLFRSLFVVELAITNAAYFTSGGGAMDASPRQSNFFHFDAVFNGNLVK